MMFNSGFNDRIYFEQQKILTLSKISDTIITEYNKAFTNIINLKKYNDNKNNIIEIDFKDKK